MKTSKTLILVLITLLMIVNTTCVFPAVVGEVIILSPSTATNPVGTEHTLTATILDDLGNPISGKWIAFEIESGPHSGLHVNVTANADGQVFFQYTGSEVGTDTIVAYTRLRRDFFYIIIESNEAQKIWIPDFVIPEVPFGTIMILLSMMGAVVLSKKRLCGF